MFFSLNSIIFAVVLHTNEVDVSKPLYPSFRECSAENSEVVLIQAMPSVYVTFQT